MADMAEEVRALKREKNAVVLAHYYAPEEAQAAADFVGDSFYLAKAAVQTDADTIVFCGVHFMGESAKILNPSRRVLMPDLAAASNAVKIVRALPEKNILFIPDQNLGGFVAKQVPEKNFYYSGGYCPVHAVLLAEDVRGEKRAHPAARVLTHPECTEPVRAASDFVGSTAEIVAYAEKSGAEEFIVCTEPGVLYELKARCPGKKFYPAAPECLDMKRNTLAGIKECLLRGCGEVVMDEAEMKGAERPLRRMLELAK